MEPIDNALTRPAILDFTDVIRRPNVIGRLRRPLSLFVRRHTCAYIRQYYSGKKRKLDRV